MLGGPRGEINYFQLWRFPGGCGMQGRKGICTWRPGSRGGGRDHSIWRRGEQKQGSWEMQLAAERAGKPGQVGWGQALGAEARGDMWTFAPHAPTHTHPAVKSVGSAAWGVEEQNLGSQLETWIPAESDRVEKNQRKGTPPRTTAPRGTNVSILGRSQWASQHQPGLLGSCENGKTQVCTPRVHRNGLHLHGWSKPMKSAILWPRHLDTLKAGRGLVP